MAAEDSAKGFSMLVVLVLSDSDEPDEDLSDGVNRSLAEPALVPKGAW